MVLFKADISDEEMEKVEIYCKVNFIKKTGLLKKWISKITSEKTELEITALVVTETKIGTDENAETIKVAKRAPVSRFVPPSLEEIKAYAKTDLPTLDCEDFFLFYDTNGWVQGKGSKKIKKWRSAAKRWNRLQAKKIFPTTEKGAHETHQEMKLRWKESGLCPGDGGTYSERDGIWRCGSCCGEKRSG